MGNYLSGSSYSSNDYELVITCAKELEHLLELEFGATGKGLHEKISSVSSQLPKGLVRRMRFLATVRNRLVHEYGFNSIPNRPAFTAAFEESKEDLRKVFASRRGSDPSSCVVS
mmetsp:Transcript_32873/g.93257  ORF Transcript_32873/g.93257 Transcript_32873/m.93257 type:complete len:114 (+) Transcript_32873:264-605(+)|eukprot:CAMPEP_0117649288 /NCGR_PEP_ID=MMETSP0804-20121206/887_1 /TAXON_ID=1074897 /ORGANISM="Tetraselmis astigmatica, Strain CCMP880" /LENGTH=113 /DNA_ID=CAMNT_0005455005 /DNA_START=183 /DNA_END=524 /DNA_ORIENTATION=+